MSGVKIRVEFDGNVVEYATLDELLGQAEFLERLADANNLIHKDDKNKRAKVANQSNYALRYAAAHYDAASKALDEEDRSIETQIESLSQSLGDTDSLS